MNFVLWTVKTENDFIEWDIVCTRKVSLQRGFGWTLLSSLYCQTILDIAVIITDFVPPFDHVCGMTSGAKMLWKLLIVIMYGMQTECHFHIHDFFLALLVSLTLASKFTLNSSRSNYCIIIYLHLLFWYIASAVVLIWGQFYLHWMSQNFKLMVAELVSNEIIHYSVQKNSTRHWTEHCEVIDCNPQAKCAML